MARYRTSECARGLFMTSTMRTGNSTLSMLCTHTPNWINWISNRAHTIYRANNSQQSTVISSSSQQLNICWMRYDNNNNEQTAKITEHIASYVCASFVCVMACLATGGTRARTPIRNQPFDHPTNYGKMQKKTKNKNSINGKKINKSIEFNYTAFCCQFSKNGTNQMREKLKQQQQKMNETNWKIEIKN